MTTDQLDGFKPAQDGPARKPRIALMGEFSAGKSTLLNMLLAGNPLPVRITATSAPPVWISYGEDAAIRVRRDGSEEAFDLADFDKIDMEDTQFIRMLMQADALEICDLFDMPGISDPNLPREDWQATLDQVDSVIWCTHAAQAWRQSEAATWEEIAEHTNGNNILLITQIDKVASERDRARLLARVTKETQGAFRAIFPLSLIDAINSKDEDSWKESGAAAFSEHLVEMLLQQQDEAATVAPDRSPMAVTVASSPASEVPEPRPSHAMTETSEDRVIPRRVVRQEASTARRRPSTQDLQDAKVFDDGTHV